MATLTWPQAVIPAFPAGYGPFRGDMQGWIQDTTGFVSSLVVFRSLQKVSGGQALPAGTFTPLTFTTAEVLEDPYGGWSHVAIGGQQPADSWLAPFTGWYEVTVCANNAPAAGWLSSGVQVSGGIAEYMDSTPTPAGLSGGCHGSLIIPATGGIDYIQGGAVASAAMVTSGTAGRFASIEICYVSSG